jgi:hypothetical protein
VTNAAAYQVAAALARAVDVLRRAPEPGAAQKSAMRALVGLASQRSATLRHYNDVLTVDGDAVSTRDPRLAAFTERLVAQHVAEVAMARGAGPDELLALALGLAAEPGQGRLKERLRDANSQRVMVVLHQWDPPSERTVSAAFEKMKEDQAVLDEWNKFLDAGARAEAERMAGDPAAAEAAAAEAEITWLAPPQSQVAPATQPPPPPAPPQRAAASPRPQPPAPVAPRSPAAPAAPPSRPTRSGFPPAPRPTSEAPPPPPQPRPSQLLEQPPALQDAVSPTTWFIAFERSMQHKFPDHFGDVDWQYRVDREARTVTAGDAGGRWSVSIALPADFVDQSAWLVAGKILTDLRHKAERDVGIKKHR